MVPSALPRLAALALTALLASCTSVAQPRDSAEAEARLKELVGDAACDSDAQCRTLAWGHKACGGPQRYVPWSTLRSDEAKLQALAQAHSEREQAQQQRDGRVSNCQFVSDPGARCVARRCVLKEGGGGGAAVR